MVANEPEVVPPVLLENLSEKNDQTDVRLSLSAFKSLRNISRLELMNFPQSDIPIIRNGCYLFAVDMVLQADQHVQDYQGDWIDENKKGNND